MFGWGREAKVRGVFSKIVSPEAVDELLGAEGFERDAFRPVNLGVVLAMIGGSDVSSIAAGVRRITELATREKAMVWGVIGPLVALSCGAVHGPSAPLDPNVFRSLLQAVGSQDFGPIKVVYWQGTAHVGLLGGETGALVYSIVFPEFDRMFSALGRLEFGETVEFKG